METNRLVLSLLPNKSEIFCTSRPSSSLRKSPPGIAMLWYRMGLILWISSVSMLHEKGFMWTPRTTNLDGLCQRLEESRRKNSESEISWTVCVRERQSMLPGNYPCRNVSSDYWSLRGRIITKVPTDPFPAGVTYDATELETKLFSPSTLHSAYPNTILSFRAPDGEAAQAFIQFQLNALYKRIGHQQILFRGISCVSHFVHSLVVGPYVIPNSCGDFGHGLYFTPSFSYAKLYAGEGGCVLVHAEWTRLLHLEGDHWRRLE